MTQLTLYAIKPSPYCERVHLALTEGKIPHKYYSVNVINKPKFFVEKVNPVGKVPAITYDGPDVPPEEPSELSAKIAESNVILEFLADAYPEAKLIPTNPMERAKVRFFMEAVRSKFDPAYFSWVCHSDPQASQNLLKAIEAIQELIPESAQYAVGDSYTIADACITPFFHRLKLSTEHDIGQFPVGDGLKFAEALKDPKFAKYNAYVEAVTNRPASKEVFVLENIKPIWTRLFSRE